MQNKNIISLFIAIVLIVIFITSEIIYKRFSTLNYRVLTNTIVAIFFHLSIALTNF